MALTSAAQVQSDFDDIARLAASGASGIDRYDAFLLSQIPEAAVRVLDVGCGLGRLTWAIAGRGRHVVGVDLSPVMIDRARAGGASGLVSFEVGNFLELDFGREPFDCIVSAAALHHMDHDAALARMTGLLAPGGRLIVNDLRSNGGPWDLTKGGIALAHTMVHRFARTGRVRSPKALRDLWARHGASDTYLSLRQVREMTGRLLPGAHVIDHWQWRYTIVWDKPGRRTGTA